MHKRLEVKQYLVKANPICAGQPNGQTPWGVFIDGLETKGTHAHTHRGEKDSEAVLGVWLPAPLPTPRALPDHGALWPLAVGVEKDLGGINV